jgi:actin-related protein
MVTNWDAMERIWQHAFYKTLKIKPEEHPLYVCVAPLTPAASRERITRIMFETFDVPKLLITIGAAMALYAAGIRTGCVVDCGDTSSHAVCLYEGYTLPQWQQHLDVGGRHLDDFMQEMLVGPVFNQGSCSARSVRKQAAVRKAVCIIKESLAFVALDFDEEIAGNNTKKEALLPDGLVTVGNERFRCPEILFQPSLAHPQSQPGIHECVFRAIQSCDVDIRKELVGSIVLAGGSTMLPGFRERLLAEIGVLVAAKYKTPVSIKIADSPDSHTEQQAIWVGSSRASLGEQLESVWMTRDMYDQEGPARLCARMSYS